MKNTSRRSFLNNFAILSAGTLLVSVPGVLHASVNMPDRGLEELWKQFCNRNGGRITSQQNLLRAAGSPKVGKGHHIKTGSAVKFIGGDVIAIPSWIYWHSEAEKPADLIVTFYTSRGNPEKILRLNRFELEALTTCTENNIGQVLPAVFESGKNGAAITFPSLNIKTSICKGHQAHVVASIFNETISFKKSIIYNT